MAARIAHTFSAITAKRACPLACESSDLIPSSGRARPSPRQQARVGKPVQRLVREPDTEHHG